MEKIPSYYILRRIHSLSGIIPLGLFLIWHLYANTISIDINGISLFDQKIRSLSEIPFYIILEILFIYLPLLFHAGFGFVLFYKSRNNFTQYVHGANFRHLLQKVTGLIAFLFIFYHAYETRLLSSINGTEVDYLWMVKIFEGTGKAWFYLIGCLACSFHFSQGLWLFLINWGYTTSKTLQKISFWFCSLLFIVLSFMSVLLIFNYIYHYQEAPIFIKGLLNIVRLLFFRGS